MPFLENVTRGRNVPRERLEEVAHHYERFGGVSPINAQNRDLIAALETELREHGIDLPISFGNRNWHPFLEDTLRELETSASRRALAFFTSAFSSYSGCRQYREDLYRAQQAVGPGAPGGAEAARSFYNHPGFVEANADRVRAAFAQIPEERRAAAPSSSPRTASRPRWPSAAATPTSSRRRRASSPRPSASTTGRSSTRAEAARRTCRGSSRTCSTTCASSRARGVTGRRHLARSASSRTTSRCSTTSTSRRVDTAAELGLELVRAVERVGRIRRSCAMIRELVEERLGAGVEKRGRRPLRRRATTCARATAACPAPGARAPGRPPRWAGA